MQASFLKTYIKHKRNFKPSLKVGATPALYKKVLLKQTLSSL